MTIFVFDSIQLRKKNEDFSSISFFVNMSGFSGKILLGDLNDFITPSVACTNPIFTEETQNTGSKIELSFDLDDPFPYCV